MLTEIISNMPMDLDFETEWFPLNYYFSKGEKLKASSLQIVWDNVEGNLTAYIDVLVTNDVNSKTLGSRYYVNNISNVDDALIILFITGFEYIKLKYVSNGTTNGLLSANILYS